MHFYLKEPNADKDTPIYLIYYLRSQDRNFKYSTGKTIHPKDWNFESRMPVLKRGAGGVKAKNLSGYLNTFLDHLEAGEQKAQAERHTITREFLKDFFDREFKPRRVKTTHSELNKDKTVAMAIDDFVATKKKSGGVTRTWAHKYENLRNKILLFGLYRGKDVQFEDIGPDWIDEYAGFLRKLPEILKNNTKFRNSVRHLREDLKMILPKAPINDNTLSRHFSFFQTFLKWSKKRYHNLDLAQLRNPARVYQPDDVHLTEAEIKLLENIELPRESLERVRDMFLVGVYSGQRYSDYSVFEKADRHGDMIIKRAEKTENECFIPLHSRLEGLLDKYAWKLPRISGQKFNPFIQEVCKLAGIDDQVKETIYIGSRKKVQYRPKYQMVTSHTARRTFITLSAEKGMPDHIIMKVTGIRDPKTLQKYKKTSQHSVMDAMLRHWD